MIHRYPTLALILLLVAPCSGGPTNAICAAHKDLYRHKNPESIGPYLRWMYVKHMPPKHRKEMWQDISGHAHAMSRIELITPPIIILDQSRLEPGDSGEREWVPQGKSPLRYKTIAPDEWQHVELIRINLRDYGWSPEIWEKLPAHGFTEPSYSTGKTEKVIERYQEYGYWRDIRTGQQCARDNPGAEWVTTRREPIYKEVTQKVTTNTKAGKWIADLPEYQDLHRLTKSQVPVVFADWWSWYTWIQNGRVVGYYDFMGVSDEATWFKVIGFDAAVSKEFSKEMLAAVARSGVGMQPRRIERRDKVGGALWRVFDNELAVGDRNPLEILDDGFRFDEKDNLIFDKNAKFKFDAREDFAHLPNGFWATALFDGNGKLAKSAPDFVGHDKTTTGNSGKIEVGLSCFRCHTNGGLQDIDDWHRNQFQPPVEFNAYQYNQFQDLQRKYFRHLKPHLDRDRAIYEAALKEACGLTPSEFASVISNRWYSYYEDVTEAVSFSRACRELGITEDRFAAILRGYAQPPRPYINTMISMWLVEEPRRKAIPTDQWHTRYPLVQEIIMGAQHP